MSHDYTEVLARKVRSQLNKFTSLAQQDDVNANDSSDETDETPFDVPSRPRRHCSSSPTTSLEHDIESFFKPSLIVRLPICLPDRQKAAVRDATIGWKEWALTTTPKEPKSRPYLDFDARELLRLGTNTCTIYPTQAASNLRQVVTHVDFNLEEIKVICATALAELGKATDGKPLEVDGSLLPRLTSLLRGKSAADLAKVSRGIQKTINTPPSSNRGIKYLRQRTPASLQSFLRDIVAGSYSSVPQILRVDRQAKAVARGSRLSYLLLQRHMASTNRLNQGKRSFQEECEIRQEDRLSRRSQWTDCCGDISAITWTGENAFICGTTAHSDSHNMQYNKPGNFVLGSITHDTLRAVPDHRIVRPQVSREQNVENSLQPMQRTQSPWLYTSVVSTAYCAQLNLAFSASFDKTVKIWNVSEDGSGMTLRGIWRHPAKVNFVVASEHHAMVATACDIKLDAVRVYGQVGSGTNALSNVPSFDAVPHTVFCGNRSQGAQVEGQGVKWAYFPATMQWGKAHSVAHLLLVGYSPRSLTDDESAIPDERKNTGELCLWNAQDNTRIAIASSSMQNVFEVIWHPTLPIFLAATSPSGTHEFWKTKTQIRLFGQNEVGVFIAIQTLDCPAIDINELTIMPNSVMHSYVTASCTNGNTYVYDTSQGDQAIHILRHGDSLDNPIHDLPEEEADTGVKFAAWGRCKSRFYTGASDGKLKVWDVTAPPGQAFVRDALDLSAGISCGLFSKDHSKLLIGDAGGKVHLLATDVLHVTKPKPKSTSFRSPQLSRILPLNIKRPTLLIHHPEPTPVEESVVDEVDPTGVSKAMVRDGLIQVHPNKMIGAVQGRNYAQTNLFYPSAHFDNDPCKPLLPEWAAKQTTFMKLQTRSHNEFATTSPLSASRDQAQHRKNCELDLPFANLTLEARKALVTDRVELRWDTSYTWEYEAGPGSKFALFMEDPVEKRLRKLQETASVRNSYLTHADAMEV